MARTPLELEDLSQTCRRDRFCQTCVRAFCSHCCSSHHKRPFCAVIPVDVDAAGRPVFTITFEFAPSQDWIRNSVIGTITAEDYATRLHRDAYCVRCKLIFCADVCPHHHRRCGPDAVIRIEENGGTHCVRCTGSESWFRYMESILGDPVDEGEDKHGLLLPVLRRAPGRCVCCGAPVPQGCHQHCSTPCAAEHDRVVAQRRERREARRAARELAKLQIH